MRWIIILLTASLTLNVSLAKDLQDAMRGETPITEEGKSPLMFKTENKDIKRKRNYPMQPPTIPHAIDNYQVDVNSNRCMTCHSRSQTEKSQAPMISVTHYMDRDGNFLADVSPRRYFCNQCHVPQVDAPALIENQFQDMDHLIRLDAKP